jgi:hypothetical protein
LADLNRICTEAENSLKHKHVPLPTANPSADPSQFSSVVPQKRRNGSFENAFNVEDMNHLRESISRIFFQVTYLSI